MPIHIENRVISSSDRERATSALQGNIDFGKTLISGELEKTPEQLSLIDKTNTVFAREFHELGLTSIFEPIDPRSVHFLTPQVHKDLFPSARSEAHTETRFRAVVVTDDIAVGVGERTFVFLHEAVHYFSKQGIVYNPSIDSPSRSRSGYSIDTRTGAYFEGLNEAIVDSVASMVQERNFKMFYGEQQDFPIIVASYPEEIKVLEAIVEKLFEYNNVPKSDISKNIISGLFTGDMSWLKDIDKVFGKGSLKLLAKFGRSEEYADIQEDIKSHFLGS